jgi:micrococcal nuclease
MLAFRRRSRFGTAVVLAAASLAASGCFSASDDTSRFPEPPAGAARARVERVSDGDTVRLAGLGRVRLIGVDTPEVFGHVECFGRAASAFARRMLPPGTAVVYQPGVEARDRYGRLLAYLWLADGRMFNAMLVERGYATPLTIPPNVEYAELFVRAARRAREAARGLWSPGACNGRNAR